MPIKIKRGETHKVNISKRKVKDFYHKFKHSSADLFKVFSSKLTSIDFKQRFKKLLTPENLQKIVIIMIFSVLLGLFYFFTREVDPLKDFYLGLKKESLLDESNPVVVMEIAGLDESNNLFALEVYKSHAPFTASHFLNLVENGFYNGLVFERMQEELIIQVADPLKNKNNSLDYPQKIPLEISPYLSHKPFGTLGMSRELSDQNSGSAQIYITIGTKSKTFLDGSYAIFGQVIKGEETIKLIREGSVIRQAKVFLTN